MAEQPSFGDLGSGRGLHRFVVDRLGLMITSGELAVDSQIVPEEVARQLDVSRTVVRESLRVLEAKGLVRPRPKVGTRVLPMTEWDLLDETVIGWRVRGPDRVAQLSELMDLRIAVEVFAVRACCEHASAAEVDAMRADFDELATNGAVGAAAAFTAADIRFHSRIFTSSGNLAFRRFVSPVTAVLRARHELYTLPDRVSAEVIGLHGGIVEAIADRDPDRAERNARTLIELSRAEVLRAVTGDAPPRPT